MCSVYKAYVSQRSAIEDCARDGGEVFVTEIHCV